MVAAVVLGLVALVAVLVLPTVFELWKGLEIGYGFHHVVRVGTLRGGISTLDVIERLGLDEARGLHVQVLRFDRTLDLACALERGDVDVAVIPVEIVGRLREKGVDVVVVAVDMLQNQAVVGRPGINASSLADLAGGRLGVFRPTGTYAMLKAYAKVVYGLDVERDFKIVDAPPMQLVEALSRGEVDAVVLWEPLVSKLLASGAKLVEPFSRLWTAWSKGRGMPVMIVYAARGPWARSHPELVKALQHVRALAAEKWNADESLALEILREAYRLGSEAGRFCWERVKFVEEPGLSPELEESVKMVWELAREGGYLKADPTELAREAFWRG